MTDTLHDGNQLPDGVGAVMRSPDGRVLNVLDPFLSDNRWPGVGVDSGWYKKLSRPEKFYAQAVAFLQATKILCETAGESGEDLRWSQGSVCFYCLNLATELFLKACISRASGGSASPIHELSKLMAQYSKIFAEPEFQFPTPWALSVSDIEGALGAQLFNSIDRSPDQLYRYGVGRDGAESAGVQFFTPGYLFNYVNHLGAVWQRAWGEVSKAQA